MAAKTATPTRADQVRRFVELDALNLVVANIACQHEDVFPGRDFILADREGDLDEAMRALWPGGEDEELSSLEYHLAAAESAALYARIMSWLCSEEGQRFSLHESWNLSRLGEQSVRKARELATDAG